MQSKLFGYSVDPGSSVAAVAAGYKQLWLPGGEKVCHDRIHLCLYHLGILTLADLGKLLPAPLWVRPSLLHSHELPENFGCEWKNGNQRM